MKDSGSSKKAGMSARMWKTLDPARRLCLGPVLVASDTTHLDDSDGAWGGVERIIEMNP